MENITSQDNTQTNNKESLRRKAGYNGGLQKALIA